jgi:glycosyltransferase involved in cell wall biosynthesis
MHNIDAIDSLQVAASLRRGPLGAKCVGGQSAGPETKPPLVSVIVPSRNEVASLPVLLERLSALDMGRPIEIVVVDDSDDDTALVAERTAAGMRRPNCRIDIVHRSGPDRQGGLSGAVVAGIRATTGRWICVMDADLQHPPELIREMLDVAINEDHDVVVASRYCGGGSSAGLGGRYRRVTSRSATAAVKLFLPGGLNGLSDPMSGFFVVARDRIEVDRLQPRGFKILLEILGRHPGLRIAEHPFRFETRYAGQSKTSLSHGVDLGRQLADLRQSTKKRSTRRYLYDIHRIVGVESDRLLPELAKFEVTRLTPGPTIRVHVCRLAGLPKGENIDLTRDPPSVSYVERMGFGVRVQVDGPEIDVEVTPYVARSPHVLYTNVVEPLLRWHLVGLDHALVHAACVAAGDDAYLVTARTDTGKTTTMLKVLDKARLKFLSDDLVVVRRDGTVLTYPKPLTISAHTVHALKETNLSRLERMALVPQSRLHSREGRQFAFLLTRYRLPVASISTMIQRLVPPPKYHVERLVRGVRTGQSARLRGMFVIERGGKGSEALPPHRALEILFANCEDAFGFPPYETLERMLHAVSEDDLRSAEHAIITEALAGVPTELMRSETLDWADRIAGRIAARTPAGASPAERSQEGLYQRAP